MPNCRTGGVRNRASRSTFFDLRDEALDVGALEALSQTAARVACGIRPPAVPSSI